jgi:UDP-N-acetylmuramoyl-L-alanyl-D-glutamate--2,6-diaminopimelate ligase
MRFEEVMRGVATLAVRFAPVDVRGVEYDSRHAGVGSLFVAMHGEATDGNRYVAGALERGAVAVVTDSRDVFEGLALRFDIGVALVERGRRALAEVSANFFEHPEEVLKLCAVTGTNGKTTTAFLIEGLLQSVSRKSVLLGTIETHIVGEIRPSPHTTPESRDVLEIFAEGVRAGATEAVMEMSSHALVQERVWGLPVDVAVFTNLTQDHLDYHGTMDEYARAKALMFRGVGTREPRIAVINGDDPFAGRMVEAASQCEVWMYRVGPREPGNGGYEFVADGLKLGAGWTEFFLMTPMGERLVRSQLTGRVNVYNLVAAIATAMARGLSLDECVRGAAELPPVPGRFETVPNDLGMTVVVDYAHTDDALRNLIGLARELVGEGRVITMFGCGGDRDRTKRPKMGRAAGEGSDVVIVTSDNPRSEDPAAIAAEVMVGLQGTKATVEVELDRGAAIRRAITVARAGDIVLLAGKGHEREQISCQGSILVSVPFDDVVEARAALDASDSEG